MTRMISFWVLVAIIVVVGLLFYQVMSGFLLPLFLAAMLVVIFQPIYRWILARCRGKAMIASGLTTVIVVTAVFLPMGWAITLAASQSISMARQLDVNRVTRQIQKLRVALNLDLPLAEDIVDLAPLIEALAEASPTTEPPVQVPPDETRSAPKPAERQSPTKPESPTEPATSAPDEPPSDNRKSPDESPTRTSIPPVDATPDSPATAPAPEKLPSEKPAATTPASNAPESGQPESGTDPTGTPETNQPEASQPEQRQGAPATTPSDPSSPRSASDAPRSDPPRPDSSPSVSEANERPASEQDAAKTPLTDPATTSGDETGGLDHMGEFSRIVEPEAPRAQELLDVIVERVKEIERQIPTGESHRQRSEVTGAIERVKALRESLAAARTSLNAKDVDGFQRDVATVRQSFQSLVTFLPGNAVRVWLKNLMNPSPARLQEYRDRVFVEIQNWLLPAANVTVGVALKLIFGTIIMIVAVFFFFSDGDRMTATITRLIPLDVRHQRELLEDFGEICRAVVMATITSAAVQSILAGLGFWMAGVESVALLMVLTMVFAMIPFVGAFTVWLPVCLWIGFVEERFWTAVLLAIYCGIVVSQSDNIVKPMILQGRSNLHPLLALLSILGGVKALGPIGILVGPMVVVFLQTLLNILHREIVSMEQSRDASRQSS